MNVVTLAHGWYPDDINSKLDFNRFGTHEKVNDLLLIGIPCTEEPAIFELMN